MYFQFSVVSAYIYLIFWQTEDHNFLCTVSDFCDIVEWNPELLLMMFNFFFFKDFWHAFASALFSDQHFARCQLFVGFTLCSLLICYVSSPLQMPACSSVRAWRRERTETSVRGWTMRHRYGHKWSVSAHSPAYPQNIKCNGHY